MEVSARTFEQKVENLQPTETEIRAQLVSEQARPLSIAASPASNADQ